MTTRPATLDIRRLLEANRLLQHELEFHKHLLEERHPNRPDLLKLADGYGFARHMLEILAGHHRSRLRKVIQRDNLPVDDELALLLSGK